MFDEIGEIQAFWFQRDFEESKVRQVLFNSVRYRPPGPDGFPLAFFQRFWDVLKQYIIAFMKEFHSRSKLSNQIRASFIALIPKKVGVDCIKDFVPINLIGCIYKILDNVLAARTFPPSFQLPKGLSFIVDKSLMVSSLIMNVSTLVKFVVDLVCFVS